MRRNSCTWLLGWCPRGVALVGGEVPDAVVAPVVDEALLHEERLVDVLVDREQLHRGDAQALQVLDEGGVAQAEVRAAQLLGDVGVQLGRALHVDLVDDRVGDRDLGRAVVAPVEVGVDDHRPGDRGGAVEPARGVGVARRIGQQGVVVDDLAADRPGVGVEQQLVGVVEEALGPVERAVSPEAVVLTRLDEGQVAVPHVAVHLGELEARLGAVVVEQAELDGVGLAAVDGHVGAHAVVVDPEGVGTTGEELHGR